MSGKFRPPETQKIEEKTEVPKRIELFEHWYKVKAGDTNLYIRILDKNQRNTQGAGLESAIRTGELYRFSGGQYAKIENAGLAGKDMLSKGDGINATHISTNEFGKKRAAP